MRSVLSRRAALLGSGSVAAAAALARPAAAQVFGDSQPAAAAQFRGVAVDVEPVLSRGGGSSARALAQVMTGQMRKVFADRITGAAKAPLLTARVHSIYFKIYSGATVSDFAFGNNDSIEGDGIVSAGGRVLSTTHVLTELPASYSGAYYSAGIDDTRLVNLGYQFVYWLRREMGI